MSKSMCWVLAAAISAVTGEAEATRTKAPKVAEPVPGSCRYRQTTSGRRTTVKYCYTEGYDGDFTVYVRPGAGVSVHLAPDTLVEMVTPDPEVMSFEKAEGLVVFGTVAERFPRREVVSTLITRGGMNITLRFRTARGRHDTQVFIVRPDRAKADATLERLIAERISDIKAEYGKKEQALAGQAQRMSERLMLGAMARGVSLRNLEGDGHLARNDDLRLEARWLATVGDYLVVGVELDRRSRAAVELAAPDVWLERGKQKQRLAATAECETFSLAKEWSVGCAVAVRRSVLNDRQGDLRLVFRDTLSSRSVALAVPIE
jgi:hypothetical protein